MTCYFRHLRDVFEVAGVELTNENKRQVDELIHQTVDVRYKNCSEVWKRIKRRMAEDREQFSAEVKRTLAKLT